MQRSPYNNLMTKISFALFVSLFKESRLVSKLSIKLSLILLFCGQAVFANTHTYQFLGQSSKGVSFYLDKDTNLIWSDIIRDVKKSQSEAIEICADFERYQQYTGELPNLVWQTLDSSLKNPAFLPSQADINNARIKHYYQALPSTTNKNDCYKNDCYPDAQGKISCHTGCNEFPLWTSSTEPLDDPIDITFYALSLFQGRAVAYIDANVGYMVTNGRERYHFRCLIR